MLRHHAQILDALRVSLDALPPKALADRAGPVVDMREGDPHPVFGFADDDFGDGKPLHQRALRDYCGRPLEAR